VETKEELDIITKMKCDMAQGYFFSKPVDLETLKNYLAAE
jgi:EAL domain-containing protein (putative c-di-GMP-specific phosphodiesterase class I)